MSGDDIKKILSALRGNLERANNAGSGGDFGACIARHAAHRKSTLEARAGFFATVAIGSPFVGYNYRMTNIEAAIGLAQLEKVEWHIQRRSDVVARYKENLSGTPEINFQAEVKHGRSVYWMTSIVLGNTARITRDKLREELAKHGIETRPFFYPTHILPMYKETAMNQSFPVADLLSVSGMNLPSSAMLKDDDIDYICEHLLTAIKSV